MKDHSITIVSSLHEIICAVLLNSEESPKSNRMLGIIRKNKERIKNNETKKTNHNNQKKNILMNKPTVRSQL